MREVINIFKSGFITIVGRPNVGKSTLINKLAGEKVAIMSAKPQTTRNTIRAIVTNKDHQIIFIDTPGIHKPRTKLAEFMVHTAENTISEVDAALFIVDATDITPDMHDLEILNKLKKTKTPLYLIINKIDLVKKENLLPLISTYKELADFKAIIPLSALNYNSCESIINEVMKVLPEGPKYFPDDIATDQPERFIVAEIVREKILQFVEDEIPHGVSVEVAGFKKRENKELIDIEVNIYCEKESHKVILIGKNGEMIKKIGACARKEIELLLGTKIFLQSWIKVKPGWRNSSGMLRNLGYI